MVRIAKYIIVSLISLMGVCTLFYSLSLYIGFSDSVHSFFKRVSIISCAAITITLALSFMLFRFLFKCNEPIFSEADYKLLEVITLVLFLIFTVSFGIKSGLAKWERGSTVYLSAMAPVILPLLSGAAASLAHHITK